MGKGLYEGRYMTLEKEAEAFISGRQKQFRAGLHEGVRNLQQYIVDNLHNTEEKHEALKNLVEVQMWAERSAAMHGIKK